VVELEVTGGEAERVAFEASLREIVGRVGLTLRTSGPAGGQPDAVAIVRIDARPPAAFHVVVVDARDGHLAIERDVSRAAGNSVACEDAVLVVRSALDALAEGMRRSEAASLQPSARAALPDAAVPPRAPAARDRLSGASEPGQGSLELGAFFRAGSFAEDQDTLFGAGPSATLSAWRGPWHPSLTVSGAWNVGQQATTDGVDAHATVLMLRAVASVALADTAGWGVDLGAGFGGDFIAVDLPSNPAARTTPQGTQVDPVATALIAFRAPFALGIALTAAVGVDSDLSPQRFVVDRAGTHDPLYAPLPVRVSGELGFSFRVIGREAAP
jgi:hypothetical protein